MEREQLDIGWRVIGVLGAAWGATDTDTIGTEHLLAGIAGTKSPAKDALAAEGVTTTMVAAVLRERRDDPGAEEWAGGSAGDWAGDDDIGHSVPSLDVVGEDGDGNRLLTGIAGRAFGHAVELAAAKARTADGGIAKVRPEHLLRGLLNQPEGRYAEVLALCGTTPDAVRARLDGRVPERGPADGPGPAGGEGAPGTGVPARRLDPALDSTRDRLIGRRQYPVNRLRRWLLRGVNWAAAPAQWVHHETYEQARSLGHRRVGTEHALLAALATHEVAAAHPLLARQGVTGPDVRQLGGARLAATGLDYATVRAALAAGPDLGTDAVPVKSLLEDVRSDDGTGPLVESLMQDGTRAGRLVRLLGDTGPQ
ncbi:Clp protease N-terminal domain-containing protein [Streptomyces sp. NPDC006798]|uniref:Clp protease N-terminal domain-containing protein n=1 Tax=Streptomyces sp. NPDC006798 TaxID=3155462 RepID=UPI003408BE1A